MDLKDLLSEVHAEFKIKVNHTTRTFLSLFQIVLFQPINLLFQSFNTMALSTLKYLLLAAVVVPHVTSSASVLQPTPPMGRSPMPLPIWRSHF
jgi:hypothetical protein